MPQGAAPDSEDCLATMLGDNHTDRKYVLELASNHTLSVRTKEWKYIEPSDGPKMIPWGPKVETGNFPNPQLFHITSSLWEEENVAEKHPQVVYDMQNVLRRERKANQK